MSKIQLRALNEANYIVKHNATVRETATAFGQCKTTIHRDVCVILPNIDITLAGKVRKILETNKNEAPFRGGIATKRKHALIRQKKSLAK